MILVILFLKPFILRHIHNKLSSSISTKNHIPSPIFIRLKALFINFQEQILSISPVIWQMMPCSIHNSNWKFLILDIMIGPITHSKIPSNSLLAVQLESVQDFISWFHLNCITKISYLLSMLTKLRRCWWIKNQTGWMIRSDAPWSRPYDITDAK